MVREKISIIGGGRLGSALAVSIAKRHKVVVSDPKSDHLHELSKRSRNISTCLVNREAVDVSAMVIIAVKPASIQDTIDSIKPSIASKLVISCAAGTPLAKLEAAGAPKTIRVMPNICSEVEEGVFAYSLGAGATSDDECHFLDIFSPLGKCVKVEEKDINAITAASGSGPAFFAYFAKAIYSAALEGGLDEEKSKFVVAQTLVGTGKLLLSGKGFDEIISKVASPGGTTEAGLKHLDSKEVPQEIKSAISEAIRKAKEMESVK
ncbi:MAG: pyrroline-5-carboxylate reductase [Candidatus Micrarchaeia archaeon]|jgi:pyrroline-5-carboxylate reductase